MCTFPCNHFWCWRSSYWLRWASCDDHNLPQATNTLEFVCWGGSTPHHGTYVCQKPRYCFLLLRTESLYHITSIKKRTMYRNKREHPKNRKKQKWREGMNATMRLVLWILKHKVEGSKPCIFPDTQEGLVLVACCVWLLVTVHSVHQIQKFDDLMCERWYVQHAQWQTKKTPPVFSLCFLLVDTIQYTIHYTPCSEWMSGFSVSFLPLTLCHLPVHLQAATGFALGW